VLAAYREETEISPQEKDALREQRSMYWDSEEFYVLGYMRAIHSSFTMAKFDGAFTAKCCIFLNKIGNWPGPLQRDNRKFYLCQRSIGAFCL
jgi:hypothetical protein